MALNFRWQLRDSSLGVVLYIDRADREVVSDIEGDGDDCIPAVHGIARHVNHAGHAVDLPFQKSSDYVRRCFRGSAGIERGNLYGGWSDRWKLRDRHDGHRKTTRDHHEQCDDRCKDGALDKEFDHSAALPMRFSIFASTACNMTSGGTV